MKKFSVVLLALATILVLAPAAMADTIIGDLAVTGNHNPWNATAITFMNSSANSSAAGSSDDITAVFGLNNIPTTINFSPVTYASGSSELFLTGNEGGDTFTYTLEGPVTVVGNNGTNLTLDGWGILTLTGYTPTVAEFDLSTTDVKHGSGQGTDSSSFSMTIDAEGQEAPEPGTLVLFGTGLIGLAGLVRRKYMVSR
jgi:hypothetical protein